MESEAPAIGSATELADQIDDAIGRLDGLVVGSGAIAMLVLRARRAAEVLRFIEAEALREAAEVEAVRTERDEAVMLAASDREWMVAFKDDAAKLIKENDVLRADHIAAVEKAVMEERERCEMIAGREITALDYNLGEQDAARILRWKGAPIRIRDAIRTPAPAPKRITCPTCLGDGMSRKVKGEKGVSSFWPACERCLGHRTVKA